MNEVDAEEQSRDVGEGRRSAGVHGARRGGWGWGRGWGGSAAGGAQDVHVLYLREGVRVQEVRTACAGRERGVCFCRV